MPCEAALDIMTMCASPRALATMSAPSRPPAPGLFSTTIGCPSRVPNHSASVRDRMSAAPAGGKLTIQRIGLDGHGPCADTIRGAVADVARAAIPNCRRESMSDEPSINEVQCGATYVPPSMGAEFPMDFDLVLRDVRLVDSRPDQPPTDIGVRGGRIAAIAPKLGGNTGEEVQGHGRLVCSG